MGSVAFLMASFLGIPYFKVMIAAIIPSFLYYLVLFLQVDAYAAKKELKGLPPSEIPQLKQVLKGGWHYIFSFVALVYFMYLGREAQSPFIASAVLILSTMARRATRLGIKDFLLGFQQAGRVLSMVLAIMAGVGFIIGAFDVTGLGSSFSSEMIAFAGGNLLMVLIFGALANLVLGAGMSISACYIFLAIVLAPALVRMGLNPIAVHLFIIYWAVASNITPPVCFASYTASIIAGSNPGKTAFQAMLLGIVVYLVPFFFVTCPALVLQAPFVEVFYPLVTIIFGTALMASALAGYALMIGRLSVPLRILFFLSGFLLSIPGWRSDLWGVGLFVLGASVNILIRSKTFDHNK